MKVVAVIPCHNEARTIGRIVTRLKPLVNDVLVINNNSTDGTGRKASRAGAAVLINKVPGYGATLKTGIEASINSKADIVVTMDGDGQHDPEEIQKLIGPIERGLADMVIGSRFYGQKGTPFYRHLGITIINRLSNVFHETIVTDTQSGYRAYSRPLLQSLEMTEPGMSFSVECLIKARSQGFRIAEVPIKVKYFPDWRLNSSVHPVKHGLQVALAVFKWRFKAEILGSLNENRHLNSVRVKAYES